jgi:transposase
VATAFPQAQVELWATDEHRIGLKPLLRRVWAPIGQRPVATVQHRFAWRYLVGFVHPASGRTIFHLATTVSIPVFEVELAEFARQVGASPRKQIVLVLDRAGWHTSLKLRVPEHVHLLFLPPYSPELQPAEHLWPLTNAALVNQHFATPPSKIWKTRSLLIVPSSNGSANGSARPRCSTGGPNNSTNVEGQDGIDMNWR